MEPKAHRYSIFSKTLDYTAVLAFLLGAVVPLAALAYVSQRYILPTLDSTRGIGLVAMVVSIGVLSLASYLVLQRIMRQSLQRMARDNRQLQAILETARALAVSPHRGAAGNTIAACARIVMDAAVGLVFIREKVASEGEESLTLVGRAGSDTLGVGHEEAIEECARLAIVSRGPVIQDANESCPFPICAVPIEGEGRGAVAVLGDPTRTLDHEADSLSTLSALGSVALRNSDLKDIQRNFFVQLTDVVVSAMDHQLGYHEGHARRVAQMTNRIGRQIGLGDDGLERLHFASLLHDIGMLKIPSARHTDPEVARKHPMIGYKMLSSIRVWEDLAPMVLHHHEWYDGSGYPEGLMGEQIPLEARIIAVADAVDSMTSRTSYKEERLSAEEMLQEVSAGKGTQFDPRIAETLIAMVEKGDLEIEG